jgi:CheY-like chemotaxis protein
MPQLSSNLEILIVDDNDFNSFTLKEVLETNYSINCIIMNNGLAALKHIMNTRSDLDVPKLIFMDCSMPIMNGFDATIQIK